MRQRRSASASAPRELDQRREVMVTVCMAQGRQIVRPKVGGRGQLGAAPGERLRTELGYEQVSCEA